MIVLKKVAAIALLLLAATSVFGQDATPPPKTVDSRVEDLLKQDPANYVPDEYRYAVQWTPIREIDIAWKNRVWRTIDARDKDNRFLHSTDAGTLAGILVEGFHKGLYKAYSDDRFTTELTKEAADELLAKAGFDLSKCTKYRLKEDWMYLDNVHQLVVKIIAIAPVKEKTAIDGAVTEEPLFWLYYPATRKYLAQQEIRNSTIPSVRNLDQLLETRKFNGAIVKVSSRTGTQRPTEGREFEMMMRAPTK